MKILEESGLTIHNMILLCSHNNLDKHGFMPSEEYEQDSTALREPSVTG